MKRINTVNLKEQYENKEYKAALNTALRLKRDAVKFKDYDGYTEVLDYLGGIYYFSWKSQDAIEVWEEYIKCLLRDKKSLSELKEEQLYKVASAYCNIGNVYFYELPNNRMAKSYYLKSISLIEKNGLNESTGHNQSVSRLGDAYMMLSFSEINSGDYINAQKHFERAMYHNAELPSTDLLIVSNENDLMVGLDYYIYERSNVSFKVIGETCINYIKNKMNTVPIEEDSDLLHSLFKQCNIGSLIGTILYTDVATVYARIFTERARENDHN